MRNRKSLWILLLVCAFVFALAGCSGADTENIPQISKPIEELYFDIDAYTLAGGMLQLTYADSDPTETGCLGLMGYTGDTVRAALSASNISAIEPVLEGDSFEGWMLFEIATTVGEDGEETQTYELHSGDDFYTSEELMAMPIPEYDCIFVAKWASIPVDSYFAEEDYMWEEGETTGCVILLANGGQMFYQSADGSDPYDCTAYAYWLADGQTLNDVTATDKWDTLVEVKKDGAEFIGWTVYDADSTYYSNEPVNEGATISFPFMDVEDFEYITLENAVAFYLEQSNEDLHKLVVEGNTFVAVANWQ